MDGRLEGDDVVGFYCSKDIVVVRGFHNMEPEMKLTKDDLIELKHYLEIWIDEIS